MFNFVLKNFSVLISKRCAQDSLDLTLSLKYFFMEHLKFLKKMTARLSKLMDNMQNIMRKGRSKWDMSLASMIESFFQGSHFYSLTYLLLCLIEYFLLKIMPWTSVGEGQYFGTWHLLVDCIFLAYFDSILLNDWKIEIMPLKDLWKFYLTDLFNWDNGVVFR
jgi:hypothetical protein